MRTILVTGSAGFIGYHVVERLLRDGWHVIGLDCVSPYYDPELKEARVRNLKANNHFTEARISLEDREAVFALMREHAPERIIHLAAQPVHGEGRRGSSTRVGEAERRHEGSELKAMHMDR